MFKKKLGLTKIQKTIRLAAVAAAGAVLINTGQPTPSIAAACSVSGTAGTQDITGQVFRDYNANGASGAEEAGAYIETGIIVTGYWNGGDCDTTVATDGTYSLTVPTGEDARIEVTNLPSYIRHGVAGADSKSLVQFVTAGDANIDFGVANPSQYCQDNPDLATPCYVSGDQSVVYPVFVAFDGTSGTTSPGEAAPAIDNIIGMQTVDAPDLGTTYGVAYHKNSESIFASSFTKRLAGFGPSGIDAIYKIDFSGGAPVTTTFMELSNAPYNLNLGTDTHPSSNADNTPCGGAPGSGQSCFFHDPNTWDQVGRSSYGDLDISDDQSTLYAINLATSEFIEIAIGADTPVAPGSVTTTPLPEHADCLAGTADTTVGGGIGTNDGIVYVSTTCTADNSGDLSKLTGYVYEFTPGTGFSALPVFSVDFDYPRGCINKSGAPTCTNPLADRDWMAWSDTLDHGEGSNSRYRPQPWITDIEFDHSNMILGVKDRNGDQTGYGGLAGNLNSGSQVEGDSAGDILRACGNQSTGWVLEDNATCGDITSGGAGVGEGASTTATYGEFYYGDTHHNHEETATGGLVSVQGSDLIAAVYDPWSQLGGPFDQYYDQGVIHLSNTTGAKTYSTRLVNGTNGDPSGFGKTAGLGDLEAFCTAAPVEIGNRVWLDADANGIQDPGEVSISGVTVTLTDNLDVTIATAVTDADGSYFFSTAIGVDTTYTKYGLTMAAGTTYKIRVDTSQPTLSTYSMSPADTDGTANGDQRDSDGVAAAAFSEKSFVLETAGNNNHSYDFGFTAVPPASLGDFVWIDFDNNGQQDVGEPGLPGVTVNLYEDTNVNGCTTADILADTQATNGSGNYSFTGLTPGAVYCVEFDHSTVPAGYTPSSQDTGADATDSDGDETTGLTTTHILVASENRLTIDQGYVPLFSLGNRVWLDDGAGALTNNGIQNGSETGIAGVTVKLLNNSSVPIDNPNIAGVQDYDVVTDINGCYRFDGLISETYKVGILGSSVPSNLVPSTGFSVSFSPDQVDHGMDTLVSGIYETTGIALGLTFQPTGETDFGAALCAESPHGNANSNLAIDFGFAPFTDLTISKNVAPATYVLGLTSAVVYTVDATNAGPSDVTNLVITDNAPANVTFGAWTCSITNAGTGSLTEACGNASGTGNIAQTATLNVGGIATYVINASVGPAAIGTIVNTASEALPLGALQDPSNNLVDLDTASITPQLQTPSIILDKSLYETHNSGAFCNTATAVDELVVVDKLKAVKDFTYCFTITNDGNTYLDTITMSDAVLGIDESDMTILVSDPLPLAPGDSLTYYYETTSDTSIDNSATVNAIPVLPGGTPTGQPPVEYTDPTALLIYISDPPIGIKSGTLDTGEDIITWDMIWINDSAYLADGVVISDEVPEGTTYQGNLVCTPHGASVVVSCIFEAPSVTYPRGRVLVTGDIAADPGQTTPEGAANEIVITFDVSLDVPDEVRTYENQGDLFWDADKDGDIDFTVVTDDPAPGGSTDPTVVQVTLSDTGIGIATQAIIGTGLVAIASGVAIASKKKKQTTR